MKRLKNKVLISAFSAMLLTGSAYSADVMNTTPPELIGEVYSTVSKNLIANFNSDSLSWLKAADRASISNPASDENEADKYILMTAESGGKCELAKNFRALKPDAVCEFKVMPEESDGLLEVYVYDRGSFPVRLLCIDGTDIVCAGETVAKCDPGKYTRVSAILGANNTYSLYVDENPVKSGIPVSYAKKLTALTAVKFCYSSAAASALRLDDVYAYAGSALIDEFDLLGDTDKAIYRTRGAVAFVSGYGEIYADGISGAVGSGITAPAMTDGRFYVPLAYTLNNLDIQAGFDSGTVTASHNGISYTFSTDKALSSAGEELILTSMLLPGGNDLMICADDLARIFSLSKYFDGEDMCILSKSASVYELSDDVSTLSSLLKTKITNLTYSSDSLGRRVKIGSSTDYYKAKLIPIASVSAEYIPQAENPPAAVTDGDFSTRFAYDNNEKTLDIDLGEIRNISGYAISWYNGSIRTNEYILHYSEDGVNWNSLPKVRSTGITNNYEYTAVQIKARYIKYQGFGTYANADETYGAWNSVTEIAFFEEG